MALTPSNHTGKQLDEATFYAQDAAATILAGVQDDIDAGDATSVATASADATSKANTAQSNAVSTASTDATSKANAAQAAAIASANGTSAAALAAALPTRTAGAATAATALRFGAKPWICSRHPLQVGPSRIQCLVGRSSYQYRQTFKTSLQPTQPSKLESVLQQTPTSMERRRTYSKTLR